MDFSTAKRTGTMFMFKKKKKAQPSTRERRSREIPLSDIVKATNNFDESLVIGRGAFGVVYKGEVFDGKTHVLAAIKRLNALGMQGAPPSWPTEVEKLATFRHYNLASLIGYYVKEKEVIRKKKSLWKKSFLTTCEKEVILVYEYFPNGTLKDHLHVYHTSLSWTQRLNICADVARALRYLHTHTGTETGTLADATLMHGDLKSSNILLTESLSAKVSDFGLSKIGPARQSLGNGIILSEGSYGYVDCHSLDSGCGNLTRKSDVYSFGAVLLEMLCRKPLIDVNVHNDIRRSLYIRVQDSVRNGSFEDMIDPDLRNEVSLDCLKEFYEIARRCLDPRPQQRPRIAELVNIFESSVFRDPSNRKGKSLDVPRPSVKEFTFDDLEKATQGFSRPLISEDGQGSGDVFFGWVKQDTLDPSEEGVGIVVAVKRITSEIPRPYDEWLEEVSLLGRLDHPNIIKLLGWCNKDEHERWLIYEHVNKSLYQFIHQDEPLPWKKRLEIMKGVVSGLEYLYTTKGVACYFQCSDVLLDDRFNAKIGGFGWTEVHERHDGKRLKGSFGYKTTYDSDTRNGQKMLTKDDVASFGLVLMEVITGRYPGDLLDVFMAVKSLEMQAPKSKSNIRKLKEMMDPRLEEGYSEEGAFKCMELASRCTAGQPSRAEILWCLEQIYHLDK